MEAQITEARAATSAQASNANVLNLRSERRARRSTKRWAGSIKRTPRRNRWP